MYKIDDLVQRYASTNASCVFLTRGSGVNYISFYGHSILFSRNSKKEIAASFPAYFGSGESFEKIFRTRKEFLNFAKGYLGLVGQIIFEWLNSESSSPPPGFSVSIEKVDDGYLVFIVGLGHRVSFEGLVSTEEVAVKLVRDVFADLAGGFLYFSLNFNNGE